MLGIFLRYIFEPHIILWCKYYYHSYFIDEGVRGIVKFAWLSMIYYLNMILTVNPRLFQYTSFFILLLEFVLPLNTLHSMCLSNQTIFCSTYILSHFSSSMSLLILSSLPRISSSHHAPSSRALPNYFPTPKFLWFPWLEGICLLNSLHFCAYGISTSTWN